MKPCLTHIESAPLASTMESSRTHGPQQGAALMKRTTKYVALDVHQATTLASVREESGRVIARSILPTDGPALTEFFRGMRGAIHVAIEEGTQAQWLHDLLAPHVDRLIVCDRRGQPRQGNKDDRHDADALSEQLRRGGLRAAYHGGGTGTGLKELTRCYQNLVEDTTRVMLRLKALFRARAIQTPGRADYVLVDGQAVRRRRAPLTRGLNRNHNRLLKHVFKSAATAARARPGPLQDWHRALVARGLREPLADVTLARKLAALTLRLWKKGERYDPTQLTQQAR